MPRATRAFRGATRSGSASSASTCSTRRRGRGFEACRRERKSRMTRPVLCAMLLAILAVPAVLSAQTARGDLTAREREFIETLRRESPASAERFIALRNASDQALAELRRREAQVNGMPTTELRGLLLPQLKQAQRNYVDAQFKILDFLDERDRGII